MPHDPVAPPVAYRVLLVENDALLRESLTAAFREPWIELVGSAGTVREATRIAAEHPIDVLLTDLELGPGPNGLVLAHALRRSQPDLGVVVLTSYADPRLVGAKLSQLPDGAEYVLKQSIRDLDVLRRAIARAALRGSAPLDADPAALAASGLSDSLVETMRLVAEGLSNAEIARRRTVTERSVEVTISRIIRQLGLSPDPARNPRVAVARAYFEMSGADAPDASRSA
jgi:DNA-binding NarL/FixJ family response regulator